MFNFALIVIRLIDLSIRETFQLIIMSENDKITPEVGIKLL